MWKRKRKADQLPWYRTHNYKGNLTEAEKRQLDAFRMQPKHPAAQEDDLPEEAQDYIGRIELELYDLKQEGVAGRAFAVSAIGAALLLLNYNGCFGTPTIWTYAGAALLLVLPWIWYRREWNKNAEEFLPSDDAAYDPTDEAIRQEWEMRYISQSRRAGRDTSN